MLNSRRYKDEILYKKALSVYSLDYIINLYYLDNKYPLPSPERTEAVIEWLLSDYQEPIKLSRLEYEILKYLDECGFEQIIRDSNIGLVVLVKPNTLGNRFGLFNDLFQFISSKNPMLIKDIIDNCEIINEKKDD